MARHPIVEAILGDVKDHEKGPDLLEHCAEELIECIHAKDAAGVANALKTIFEELDKEPHEEGPHPYEE